MPRPGPGFGSGGEANGPAPVGVVDALDEVNECRARRGLRPFLRDGGLTAGAMGCAAFRAARGIDGHTPNDFGFLPPGCQCRATGAGAWPAGTVTTSGTWGTCCTFEPWTYAGAAWVPGRDGKRYMSLFVR